MRIREMSGDEAGGRGDEPARFILEVPSDPAHIDTAVSYLVQRCRAFSYSGSRLNLNLRVSVAEALANAVLYGNRRDRQKAVHVEVTLTVDYVAIQVTDQGSGFDPGVVPDPTRPENIERNRGRGIFLLRNLMDEVSFNERGNQVCMVLHRVDPER